MRQRFARLLDTIGAKCFDWSSRLDPVEPPPAERVMMAIAPPTPPVADTAPDLVARILSLSQVPAAGFVVPRSACLDPGGNRAVVFRLRQEQ